MLYIMGWERFFIDKHFRTLDSQKIGEVAMFSSINYFKYSRVVEYFRYLNKN